MIDLILHAATRADMRTFAINSNLLVEHIDKETGKSSLVPRPNADWLWWYGNGKIMKAAAVLDAGGNVTTHAKYFAGVFIIARISGAKLRRDTLRKRFKSATSGTRFGVPYREIDGVRLFSAATLTEQLKSKGLPVHQWQGGNQF